MSSDTEGELRIERRLLYKEGFENILLLDAQQIEQESLYNKLGFRLNMFDIGMYISQSESLDFLQNKYKDRKEYVSYDSIILPFRQISKFVENYEEYIKYIDNAVVKELKGVSKQIYMALFYSEEISLPDKNESLLQALGKDIGLLKDFSESKWSVDEEHFEKVNIDKKVVERLKELLLSQQRERNQLADADKVLAQMTKVRKTFTDQYNHAVEAGKFNPNKCPLCGTDFTDIDQAITETESFIRDIHTDGVKVIEDLEIEISGIFQQSVIPIFHVR